MKRKMSLFDYTNYILFVLFSVTIIYPFINLAAVSLTNPEVHIRTGLYVWPTEFTLMNYKFVFAQSEVISGYANTVYRTVLGTFTSTIMMAVVAYAIAKKDLPFRSFFTKVAIFTMFFNGGLIPTYLLIRDLHLINNRLVYILPALINTWSLLIIRNYFMSLPESMEESAKIDGAGELTIILRIILPISVPVLATIALWQAVHHWNAWFDSLMYMNDGSKQVMQVYLRRVISNISLEIERMTSVASNSIDMEAQLPTPQTVKAAIILIATLPILCVYPFIQKYFVKGIMVGSLKG